MEKERLAIEAAFQTYQQVQDALQEIPSKQTESLDLPPNPSIQDTPEKLSPKEQIPSILVTAKAWDVPR